MNRTRAITPSALLLPLLVQVGCSLGLPGKPDPADAGTPTTVTSSDGGVAGDGGPLACPPDPTGFTPPAWRAVSGAHQNRCNETQATQLADCIGSLATNPTACDGFKAANTTCYQCAVTSSIATVYGAIIDDGSLFYPNVPGCIAAATGDLGPTGCGAKFQANSACGEYSCTRCSDPDFLPCYDNASDGVCKRSYDDTCSDAVFGQCVSLAGNMKEGLLKPIRVICGAP